MFGRKRCWGVISIENGRSYRCQKKNPEHSGGHIWESLFGKEIIIWTDEKGILSHVNPKNPVKT